MDATDSSKRSTAGVKRPRPVEDPLVQHIDSLLATGMAPAAVAQQLGMRATATTAAPLPADAGAIAAAYRAAGGARWRVPGISSPVDVAHLLASSSRVLVVTGAGISVSCGVPDFRSPHTGLYDILRASRLPALKYVSEPQELFDIELFREDPTLFYSVAHVLYATPGGHPLTPSLTHRFIAALEASGRLLRQYTQNIDGLEAAAGVSQVVQCHGTLRTASCMRCGRRVPATAIADAIAARRVPSCEASKCAGRKDAVMKPDVVFFREALPPQFDASFGADAADADLLLVIGSSLKVKPVSTIVGMIRPGVPAVLINREPVPPHAWDVECLGDCDDVCRYLWQAAGMPGLQTAGGGSSSGGGGAAAGGAAVASAAKVGGADAASSSSSSTSSSSSSLSLPPSSSPEPAGAAAAAAEAAAAAGSSGSGVVITVDAACAHRHHFSTARGCDGGAASASAAGAASSASPAASGVAATCAVAANVRSLLEAPQLPPPAAALPPLSRASSVASTSSDAAAPDAVRTRSGRPVKRRKGADGEEFEPVRASPWGDE